MKNSIVHNYVEIPTLYFRFATRSVKTKTRAIANFRDMKKTCQHCNEKFCT